MFFRKKPVTAPSLLGVVRKTMDTGYLLWNVSDDLGHSCDAIMASTPLVKMSYAYARRSAAAGMYNQGLIDKSGYDHVVSIFKAFQQQTGHTVEFQEAAFADASEHLLSYHFALTSFFSKRVVHIANDYDIPEGRLSDADLVQEVLDTMHTELMENIEARRPSPGLGDEGNTSEIPDVRVVLRRSGWETAVAYAAEAVLKRIPDDDTGYRFTLEELDGASQGNEYARDYARRSGISPEEFAGALSRDSPDVSGPGGPQQLLVAMTLQLLDDREAMARFRCNVGREVRKEFRLGVFPDDLE